MKTFKGNHNIEAAFANFIEVVEAETGLKIQDVDCWIHRAEQDQVEAALNVEGAYKRSDCIKVVDEFRVWGLADINVYLYPLDESVLQEEEEEDPFIQCDRCNTDTAVDEMHSDVEGHCRECGDQQLIEWEQESNEQTQQYMNDRI